MGQNAMFKSASTSRCMLKLHETCINLGKDRLSLHQDNNASWACSMSPLQGHTL